MSGNSSAIQFPLMDIDPPTPITDLAQNEKRPGIEIRLEVVTPDLTRRSTGRILSGDANDPAIAAALVDCIRGFAAMVGPGMESALQQWVPIR